MWSILGVLLFSPSLRGGLFTLLAGFECPAGPRQTENSAGPTLDPTVFDALRSKKAWGTLDVFEGGWDPQ